MSIRNNLHVEQKRALVIMLVFALLFSLIGFLIIATLSVECSQLSSLLRSKYTYSATVAGPIFQDDYYLFKAGISFLRSPDSPASLNADILMQSSDSHYSNAVDWNTDLLGADCIAITSGLVKSNNLQIGDSIYSKHVVDDTIHEYKIEAILPETSSSIVVKDGASNTEGIILMGYDKQYVESITHTMRVYTDDPIDVLAEKSFGTPTNILYRDDEILMLIIRILPYCLLFVLLSVSIAVALVYSITKAASANFKRLVALGYKKERLNSCYNRLIYSIGFASVLFSLLIVFAFWYVFAFSIVVVLLFCFLIITEVTTIIISSWLSKRKLWR